MESLNKLDKKTILADAVFEEVFNQEDEIQKARLLLSLQDRAAELGVKGKFDQMVKAYKKVDKEIRQKKMQETAGMDNYTNFDGPYEDRKSVV